jgi:dimethylhistidine N-methyltransferase
MRTTTCADTQSQECLARREPLIADLLRGLRDEPKHVSPSYFYDARGSALFDAICELPEYYVTRTETQILETHASDIASCLGEEALLVEFGSGASVKTRILLNELKQLSAYVPVEISRSHLLDAAQRISNNYPHVEVLPVCADFTLPFDLPKPKRPPLRTVMFFPGSTIGNFDPSAAIELMRLMRNQAGPGGGLVIGTDLVKDPVVLRRAYNDAAGVTAQFNLNMLRRLNREFGTNFDLAAFTHEAIWNAADSRIEMHLISERNQAITLDGEQVRFALGERLVTEHSHKYTLEDFRAQAAAAGWRACREWLDDRRYFAVHYLEAC